jgi:hypothetical protein
MFAFEFTQRCDPWGNKYFEKIRLIALTLIVHHVVRTPVVIVVIEFTTARSTGTWSAATASLLDFLLIEE